MNRHLLGSSTLQDFSESAFSRRTSLTSGLTLGNNKKRPKIEIELEDQPPGLFVPSYTTRERIHGYATIHCSADVHFDEIHVTLQGTSRTWVEKIATAAPTNPRTRAFHTFLRLLQPIEDSDIPEQHILRADRTYKIPFEFVIPERLLPQACNHSRQNAQVEEEHLKLPPSLGDAMVSGDGKTLHTDLAPEMVSIVYSIRVIITRKANRENTRPTIIADSSKKLRIIPATDEAPPLSINDEPGDDYVLHKCKTVKKGVLIGKSKIGTLDVQAGQPAPMRLPSVRDASKPNAEPVMTMVTMHVRFNPTKSNVKPPKLQMLWSRLKVATFFSTVPQKSIPTKSAAFSLDNNRGLMAETVNLSSRNLGGMTWTKHVTERRDSAISLGRTGSWEASSPDEEPTESPFIPLAHSPDASPATTPVVEDGPGYTFYTAEVLVPVELPYTKCAFVPTFHSCLISRVYALEMTLNVSTGTGNTTSVHLKVPVQITSTPSENPVTVEGMVPEGGIVGARAEHNDPFAPNMANPDEAPPDFEDWNQTPGQQGPGTRNGYASDGELHFTRPNWTTVADMHSDDRAALAAELDREHLTDAPHTITSSRPHLTRTVSPRSGASMARSALVPGHVRSESPRTRQLTNDEILNTENYPQDPDNTDAEGGDGGGAPSSSAAEASANAAEQQFGSFRFEPVSFARPGEGRNQGSPGPGHEGRRASEGLPPGYASVAAGTMLMGSGGMVRALS